MLDDTGAPIAEARVTVDPPPGADLPWRRAMTDAEGRFRIDRLVDGAYSLAVDPPESTPPSGTHHLPGGPHVVHAGDERVIVTIARGAALVIEHTGADCMTYFHVCSCEPGRDVRRIAFEQLLLDRERRRWGTTVPAGRYACVAVEADEMLFAKVNASVGPDPIVVAANRVSWGFVRLVGAGNTPRPVAFFDGQGDRIRVVTAPVRPIALPAGRLRVVVDGRTHRVDVPAGGTVDVDVTTSAASRTVPQQGQNPSSSP